MFAGDLTEFALPAVVRVLAGNGKTGLLEVVTDGRPGGIELIDGAVRAATVDRRRAALARRLLGQGSLDITTLLEVLEADGPLGGDARLAELLMGGELLPPDKVAAALKDQTIDAMLQLTRATAGTFHFRADAVMPGAPAELMLSADEVLAEVDRRQSTIATLSSARLRPRSVLRVVAGGAEVPVTLSGSAWRLLALLDGQRTVADLLDITGGGLEDSYQQLAELLDARVTSADGTTSTQAQLEDHQRLTALERAWGTVVSGEGIDPLPSARPSASGGMSVAVTAPVAASEPERTATITSLASRGPRRASLGAAFDEHTLRRLVAGVEALA